MAYRKVREWPLYIQYVWRVGLVTLPILGGIAVSRPTGLLSTYMILVFVAMIGMWAGTGVVVWCTILYGERTVVWVMWNRVYGNKYGTQMNQVNSDTPYDTDLENPTRSAPFSVTL